MKKRFGIAVAATSLMLAFGPAAQAQFLDTQLSGGQINVFEDQSREAFIDVDNNNVVSIGDVLIGFIRIDNKTAPNNVNYDNNLYAIFTQQVTAVGAPFQSFGPTTEDGLELSSIVAGAPANGVVAVYSSAVPITDLIINSAGATLADYFNVITTNMDLEFIAGFSDPEDFITATAAINVTADANPATGILQLQGGETAAFFTGGLSILVNNTAFQFADAVDATNPIAGVPTTHDLAISGGNATGGSDDPNFADWADASGFTSGPHNQCTSATAPNTPCGFRDNADFSVAPFQVPEPGALALVGLGLLGLGAIRRRRRA